MAEIASTVPSKICFDLGTGTGEILKNATLENVFSVGIDISAEALLLFDTKKGQPVLCSVKFISSVFKKECADLVIANPPYGINGQGRGSPDKLRNQARHGDSLLLYRFIFAGGHLLKPGGIMIISCGKEKKEDTKFGFRAAGFCIVKEYQRNRVSVIKAQKKY